MAEGARSRKRRSSISAVAVGAEDEGDVQQDREVEQDAQEANKGGFVNKQKVLVLSTRGINARSRHLMEDFRSMLPHSKREGKLEAKDNIRTVNDIAELNGCNKILLFDTKRGQDLYIHMSCSPQGPSVKFLATNIHTMLELNFSGNHLKGSRPIVSFDAGFDTDAHWKLIKELLMQIFSVPKRHKKSKPFVDHVLSFSRLDDVLWMRNYQISEDDNGQPLLVEVGPRVVLNPVRVFEGSLGGPTLWKNPTFVPPQIERRERQVEEDMRAVKSRLKTKKTKEKMGKWMIPESEYDRVVKNVEGDIDLAALDELSLIEGE